MPPNLSNNHRYVTLIVRKFCIGCFTVTYSLKKLAILFGAIAASGFAGGLARGRNQQPLARRGTGLALEACGFSVVEGVRVRESHTLG